MNEIKAMSVILNVDQRDVQCCALGYFYHTGSIFTSPTPWRPFHCHLPKLPTHCVEVHRQQQWQSALQSLPCEETDRCDEVKGEHK